MSDEVTKPTEEPTPAEAPKPQENPVEMLGKSIEMIKSHVTDKVENFV